MYCVVALSICNTVAYQIWQARVEEHVFYLLNAGVGFLQLLASLEIVKGAQVALMRDDIDMYNEQSNTPMEPRASTINEDLGQ